MSFPGRHAQNPYDPDTDFRRSVEIDYEQEDLIPPHMYHCEVLNRAFTLFLRIKALKSDSKKCIITVRFRKDEGTSLMMLKRNHMIMLSQQR
jgi:hypothetical protein